MVAGEGARDYSRPSRNSSPACSLCTSASRQARGFLLGDGPAPGDCGLCCRPQQPRTYLPVNRHRGEDVEKIAYGNQAWHCGSLHHRGSGHRLCSRLHAHRTAPRIRGLKVLLDHPAQTEIRWKLSANLHTIHGTFKLKSGEFFFNPATGVAEGEILIGRNHRREWGTRLATNACRTRCWKAIVILASSSIRPRSKGLFKAGDGTRELVGEGTYNIHGADHPMDLPLKVQAAEGMVTATTHFTVPYVEWGMKNPSKFLLRVSKQVEIEVTAKGTIKQTE